MNLRKDAWIAVSMAGAVLAIAGLSTKIGKTVPEPSAGPVETVAPYDPELLTIYNEGKRVNALRSAADYEREMAAVRAKAIAIYNTRPMQSPVDLFRLSWILESSEAPEELALSHKLAVDSLAGGIAEARPVVLKSQDRLLLSLGRPQRYGTQEAWRGVQLTSNGRVNPEVPLAVRNKLGVGLPRPMAVTAE